MFSYQNYYPVRVHQFKSFGCKFTGVDIKFRSGGSRSTDCILLEINIIYRLDMRHFSYQFGKLCTQSAISVINDLTIIKLEPAIKATTWIVLEYHFFQEFILASMKKMSILASMVSVYNIRCMNLRG